MGGVASLCGGVADGAVSAVAASLLVRAPGRWWRRPWLGPWMRWRPRMWAPAPDHGFETFREVMDIGGPSS